MRKTIIVNAIYNIITKKNIKCNFEIYILS